MDDKQGKEMEGQRKTKKNSPSPPNKAGSPTTKILGLSQSPSLHYLPQTQLKSETMDII